MNLLFISHKESWLMNEAECIYATVGGFPYQILAVSELFDQTRILITQADVPRTNGLIPLSGKSITIKTLSKPSGGQWHKLRLIPWVWKNLHIIWRETSQADAVHTAVPGDVGSIGTVVALLQGKRLFVRHCGTFGEPVTISDHILHWLLEQIAGGKRVVLATGGSDSPPSKRNSNIHWIFSTTLTQKELGSIQPVRAWDGSGPLRLITACRLETEKNVQAVIRSLPTIQKKHPDTFLDVLGDGSHRGALEELSTELGLTSSVIFHGNVNHQSVMSALAGSHIFVFPTRVKEGFPKALLEAMACGLPSIATNVSVIPHLLQNGSGILLQDTSPEAVAQAVLQLISDPGRMRRMGQSARQAAQGYTLEAWGREIQRHLEKAWGQLRMSTRDM